MPQNKPINYTKLLKGISNQTDEIDPNTNLDGDNSITDKSITTIDQPPTKLPKINYESLLQGTKKKARQNQLLKPIKVEGFNFDDYDLVPEIRMHQGMEVVNRIRANNQRWYTQLGNFLGQFVIGEIVGGVISGVGAIGEIPDMIRDGFSGSGHVDFNNSIIRAGNNISEWARDAMPIYEVNPNESWQMDDFGWWMGNGVSVASTLSMLIPAVGTVKAAGYIARITKLADKVGDATKYYSKMAIGAGTMRHAENVRESFQVANDARLLSAQQFEDQVNFDNFIGSESGQEFLKSYGIEADNPEAKRLAGEFIAAKAGWRSYMINSTNIVFDLVQFAPLLRGFKVKTRNSFGKHHKLKKAAAKVTGQKTPGKFNWAMSKLNPLVSATGRQLTEGIEEGINFIGGQEGAYLANNILGLESSNFSDRFGEYMQDGELWESAFWGVLGGITFEGASGRVGRMLGSNKNGPHSLTGKITEINQRAAFISNSAAKLNAIQNADPNYKDITGEYNFKDITEERRQELISELQTDLAYNLGINAAVAGNVDILLDQLKNPEFQQQLVDMGLTTQEEVDSFINEAEQNILTAEDTYKKHMGSFVTSSASQTVKNSLISKGINLDLQKKKIEKIRGKLEETNTELKLNDTTYGNIEGNAELALRKAALKRSLASFTIEAARADGIQYKTEADKLAATERYKNILNKIQNELNDIDTQVNESGESLPSVKNVDERIIDNAAAIEGYKIAESAIAEDVAKIKTQEAVKKEADLQKEQEEIFKQQGIDLATESTSDKSLKISEDSSQADLLGVIKNTLLPIENKLREGGQTEAADIVKNKIDELTDRLTSDESRREVKIAKENVKGDNQTSPKERTQEELLEEVNKKDMPPTNNDTNKDKINPDPNETDTEINPDQPTNTFNVNRTSPSPQFPDEPEVGETEFWNAFTQLNLSNTEDTTADSETIETINRIINLNPGDKLSIIRNDEGLEIVDNKGNHIGWVNEISSKQNLLKKAQARLITARTKSEKAKEASKIKGYETEIKTLKRLQTLAKGSQQGDVIVETEVTSKLRGTIINNMVNNEKVFRSISESFGKPINLFMNQKDTVKQLEVIYDADGNASVYDGFMGSGIVPPKFGAGVVYTIILDNNGQPMAVPISTGKVDIKHAEFLFDAFVELANRLNKRVGGKYVNDLRNKEIKDLKDIINEITYQGKKGGIVIHNEKIEIPMTDGNVLQLFFRDKGKGSLKGAPVSGIFNMRVVTKDESTGKVKQVLSDFNAFGSKSFSDITEFAIKQLQGLRRQVNKKRLGSKDKYQSPLHTDLKSPNYQNTGEEFDSYYDYLTTEKDKQGLPVLRSDIGAIRNESGDIITHFTNPRIRVGNIVGESVAPKTKKAPVTPEADRIAALDKTLVGKDREFVDLMREKGKDQKMIDQKIKSSARNTSAGNKLLTRYKAEDTLRNPEGKTLPELVSAYSLLFTDNYIPARTINDLLFDDPDLRTRNLGNTTSRYPAQQAILNYEAWAKQEAPAAPVEQDISNDQPPEVSAKDIIEGLKQGLGKQFITPDDVRNFDLSDDAFDKLSKNDFNDIDDFLDRSVTQNDVTQGYTQEDIDAAEAWWKKNLPNVPFQVVEGLITGGGRTAFGRFHNSMVSLSNIAKEGTAYHEGFHAVFNLYLNPVQKQKILAEAVERYGEPTNEEIDKIIRQYTTYGLADVTFDDKGRAEPTYEPELELTDLTFDDQGRPEPTYGMSRERAREIALEEKMADDFMNYVMTGVEDKTWRGRIRSFFRNMYKYMKNLLGIGSNIDKLFYDINNAKFTYKADQKAIDHARSITLNRNVEGENIPDTTMPSEGFTDSEEMVLLNKLPGLYYIVGQKLNNKSIAEANKTGQSPDPISDDAIKAGIMSVLVRRFNSPKTDSVHKTNITRVIQALNNDDSDIWSKTKQIIAKDFQTGTTLDPELDNIEFDDISEIKRNWDDGSTFNINQKTRATGEVRSIVRMSQDIQDIIIDPDGGIEYVTNKDDFLGFPNFLNFDSVYPYLSNHLAGIQNAQELLDRLETLSKFDLSFMKIWEQINPKHLNPRQQQLSTTEKQVLQEKKSLLLAKFFVTFAKQSATFDVDLVSIRGQSVIHRPSRSNNNDTKVILANKWISAIVDKHANKEIDIADVINGLKPISLGILNANNLDNIGKRKLAVSISNLYSKLGINLMEKGVNKMADAIYDTIKDMGNPIYMIKYGSISGIVNNVFVKPLSWVVDNLADNNVSFDQTGSLRELANAIKFFKYDLIQNTSVNVVGKKQYTITDSNFMSDFFAKYNSEDELQRLELIDFIGELLDVPGMKDSNWLQQMIRYTEDGKAPLRNENGDIILNDEFFSSFNYSYEDGIKNTDSNVGIKYHNMEDSDWYFMTLAKFLNGGKKGWSKYSQPIPADSSNIIFITAPTYKSSFLFNKNDKGEVTNTNTLNVNSPLGLSLFNLVAQEVKSIHQAQRYLFETDDFGNVKLEDGMPIIKEGLDMRTLQKDYHYKQGPNGEKILFDKQGYPVGEVFRFNSFPELINLNVLQSHKSPDGKGFIKSQSLGDKAIQSIQISIQQNLETEMINLSGNPMFMNQIDKLWALAKTRYITKEHFIMSFLGNQKVAITESQNWFSGNISEYSSKQDSSKRAKQTNSPGNKQAGIFTNPMFGLVVIKDLVLSSPDITQIANTLKESFLKRKNYTKVESKFDIDNIINGTPRSSLEKDVHKVARHYMAINTGDAQGYVTWDRYKRQLKDNGAWNDRVAFIANKIDNDQRISPDELNAIMQPFKGFYYNRKIDNSLGKLRSRQIKYSTIPLISQLVKGTDLEILADKMNVLGMDEVVFESASKVGTLSVHKIHDENGRIIPDIFDQLVEDDRLSIELLDNDHWYKQQDVPTKLDSVTQKLGTQIKDIVLTNLSNNPIYKVAFSNADMDGKQLLKKYAELTSANIIESSNELLEELGAKVDKDGNIVFENNKQLRKILLRELVKRGATDNYIKAVLPKPGTDQFTLPLAFSGMNNRFESLLLSLFTTNVTEQKFPGFSSVQFSGAFFRTNKKVSQLTQEYQEDKMQGVEWVKGHDTSRRLRSTRDSESGIITAEVVVSRPNAYHFEDGKPIPINEMDPQLLEMLGYRIPTEAKHSMVVFKIVGFTPRATGDIIILPDDIIAQTGSDFDIDKMQVMMYSANYKGEKIKYDNSKPASKNNRKQRNNAILDIFTSILKNKHHLAETLETGNFDDLKDIRKEMDEIDGITEASLDISSFSGQDEIRKRNMSGRVLKGISASINKFGAIAQNTKMSLMNGIKFKYKLIEVDSSTGTIIKRDIKQLIKRYGAANVERDGDFVIINHRTLGWTEDGSNLNVNGDLVLKHSAQGITGAVDIGKDPTFNSFNVKSFTYPLVGAATLLGIPWKNIAWFTKQDIVKAVQDKYYESRGAFGENTPLFEIIRSLKEEYLHVDSEKNSANHGTLFGLLPEATRRKLASMMFNAKKGKIPWVDFYNAREKAIGIEDYKPYSKEELKDIYMASKSLDILSAADKRQFYKDQLQILNNFTYMRNIGNQVNEGVRLVKVDTLGAGPSMVSTRNFERLLDKMVDDENTLLVEHEDGQEGIAALSIYPSYFGKSVESVYPTLNTMYEYSNMRSVKTIGHHFLEESPRFRGIIDSIMTHLKGIGFMYNDKVESITRNYITSYLLKDASLFSDMGDQDIRDILGISPINDRETTSLARDILDIQKDYPGLSQAQNHILTFLNPKTGIEEIEKNGGLELIDILDIPNDPIIQNQISRSLLRMYRGTSLNADGTLLPEDVRERLRDVAIKIAKYEFFVSGYNFGFNSLTELIPTEMKVELGLGEHLEKKIQEFSMLRSADGENIGNLVHKTIRSNWKRHVMVPLVKRQVEIREMKGQPTRVTKKGTGNWTPGRDGIIVTSTNLSNEPMSVQNSEYVYVPIYVIDKYKTAKTGEKVYRLASDNLYMKVGTDKQLGLQYYIPVPKLGIPGKMIEFGDQSLLETNIPIVYKRRYIPYNNELEARDYVINILNGDTNRAEVIESIKKEDEAKADSKRGLTTDVLVEMSKKQRTGGMQTVPKVVPVAPIVTKEGVSEVFKKNSELSEIGTEEQYSAYLDTVFPESKVKDIVYHISRKKFEKFDKKFQTVGMADIHDVKLGSGFYFADIKEVKKYAASVSLLFPGEKQEIVETDFGPTKPLPKGVLYSSLLNIKNPQQKTDIDVRDRILDKDPGVDGFELTDNIRKSKEYVVFEPEQIHILGSKQDVKGFKEFVSKPAVPVAPEVTKALKSDVILPIGTSGSGKSTWIKSINKGNDFVVISPDEMRIEFTGDINDKSKDNEIYKAVIERTIKAIEEGKRVIIDSTNLRKDRRKPFIKAVKKALPDTNIQYKLMPLDPELAKQRIKEDIAAGIERANVTDSTIDRHAKTYKEMLKDVKSEDISEFIEAPVTPVDAQIKKVTLKELRKLAKKTDGLSENTEDYFYIDDTFNKKNNKAIQVKKGRFVFDMTVDRKGVIEPWKVSDLREDKSLYYKETVDGAGRIQKSSPNFPITEAEKVLTEIQNLAKPIIALETPVTTVDINSINNSEANIMDNQEMVKMYKEYQAAKNRTDNNSEKKCD
jgi:predicted kinase